MTSNRCRPQSINSGGRDNADADWGNVILTLNVDTQTAGLWPGGFFKVQSVTSFEDTLLQESGAIVPANMAWMLPTVEPDTGLQEFTFTQFLSQHFGVFLGKINTIAPTNLLHGDYTSGFLNTGLNLPLALALVALSAYGVGALYVPSHDLTVAGMVIDPNGTIMDDEVEDTFDDGVMAIGSVDLKVKPWGLPGHQTLTLEWSSKDRTSLIASKLLEEPVTPICVQGNKPWKRVSLDGITLDATTIVECKLLGKEAFELLRDHQIVPKEYWPQVVHQIDTCEVERCLFVGYHDATDACAHTFVEREQVCGSFDTDSAGDAFWQSVLDMEEPEPEGAEIVVRDDEAWLKLAERVKAAKAAKAAAEEEEKAADAALKKLDGDAPRVEGAGVVVTRYYKAGSIDYSHYLMGDAFRFKRDFASAITAYQAALGLDPGFGPTYVGLARARLGVDPNTDVRSFLDEAIRFDPNFGEAYLERANARIRQNDIPGALSDLARADSLLSNSRLVYFALAQARLKEGDTDLALQAAEKANQLDVTYLPTYLMLGELYARTDRHQEPVDALNIYIRYRPDDSAAFLLLGRMEFQNGEYEESISSMNRVIRMDRNQREPYLYRFPSSVELGQGEEADEDIDRVLLFYSDSFDARLAIVRLHLLQRRNGSALLEIDKAEALAETDEQKAQAYYWGAICL